MGHKTVVWGRLYGKLAILKGIDLCEEFFSVGLELGNDFSLKPALTYFNEIHRIDTISPFHFRIYRENCSLDNPVYIKNMSTSGTYVNGNRLGRGHEVLHNDDIISLADPNYADFVFKDSNPNRGDGFPNELRSKYHIGKKLGSGSFGEVSLVYDLRTGCNYAMKLVKTNNDFGTRLAENEASIMMSLRHTNIIQMHDIEIEPDSVYMVLEYMKGGDLRQRLRESANKQLPENISNFFFYQMCLAVQYLHRNRITHRDLKPDNILLASTEPMAILKVTDFGLSKIIPTNSIMNTECGTRGYWAPEIETHKYTKKVDIWSLGVILFECLSGHRPCKDIPNHTEFNNLPSPAKSLVKEMLTVDPDNRPSIEDVLNYDWLAGPSFINYTIA